jgi:hypothetical protein
MIRNRKELPALLQRMGLTGTWAELGVAKGAFSKHLAESGVCEKLFSIDSWADPGRHHDDSEYLVAAGVLKPYPNCSIIRKTFAEALLHFPDGMFDFIYIDGYAHTGQDAGRTLADWWPKLRSGGVYAGHDYHVMWRPTIKAVDAFVLERSLQLNVTTDTTYRSDENYPSWWVIKP